MNTLKNSYLMLLCLLAIVLPFHGVGADAPKILKGHTSTVDSVVYSPDGNTLASVCNSWGDNTIRLWNAKTGGLIHTLTKHSDDINAISFSPDGKILASASDDKTVKLWDVTTGDLKYTFSDSNSIKVIAYSPNGNTLAAVSWSDDNTVKLWKVKKGVLKHSLAGHTDGINAIAYSSDGQTLASASDDKTIKLWDVKTGKVKHTLTGHSLSVNQIVYSPDGTILASAGYDNTIKLWDPKTGEVKNTLTGHSRLLNAMVYSSDNELLASAEDYKSIKLWVPKTGEIKHSLVGHRNSAYVLAHSPTGSVLASVDDDRIKLWNTQTGKLIVNLPHSNSVKAIAYSPDGQTLIAASGREVQVWDVSAKTLEQLMYTQLNGLPETIQKIEEFVPTELSQMKQKLVREDSELISEASREVSSSQDAIIRWFEELHKLEKAGNLEELKKLDLPKFPDRDLEWAFLRHKKGGINFLEQELQLTNSYLPVLARLRKHSANVPILDRVNIREKMEVLEARLLSVLKDLRGIAYGVLRQRANFLSAPHAAAVLPEDAALPASPPPPAPPPASVHRPLQSHFDENPTPLKLSTETQSLPHDGLFIRRNNSFGTQLTTSMKELITQGVMIKQEQIRFDDFVAINTQGVPSPKPNNAMAVSHGIATIPAHQKHDNRATHYLEIALKTADAAPTGHPETQAPPVNYIFVVDVSGSMRGEKIDTVKASIRELFTRLRADDVIGVIAFDHHAKTILESTPKQQISADEFGKIINSLTAGGSTDINLALAISIDEMRRHQGAQRVNQLFLLSDGNPTAGETDWINIRQNIAAKLRQNTTTAGNIRLSTLVFGTDANKVELDRLAGITGGQSTFVIEPEKDVIHSLQQELARRTHLATINVQMQIEINPNIEILHFYGHDLITDPAARVAVERQAEVTGKSVETDYGVKSQPDLIKEDKGIRVFVPNLAVGETYWVVFELAVPEPQQSTAFGKATVQYFDTFARQNQKPQFDLSPKGPIEPQWVVQHALGLWTSEVAAYTLNDVEADDLKTAEQRIQAHISVLETAESHLTSQQPVLRDDIITLNKFLSLAKNLNQGPQTGNSLMYLNYGLGELDKVRNGFVQRVRYGE